MVCGDEPRSTAVEKPKRVITLARKEQNRAAQKIHSKPYPHHIEIAYLGAGQRRRERLQRVRDETSRCKGKRVELRPHRLQTSISPPPSTLAMGEQEQNSNLGVPRELSYEMPDSNSSEVSNMIFDTNLLFPWPSLSSTTGICAGPLPLGELSSTLLSGTNPLFDNSEPLLLGHTSTLAQSDQTPLSQFISTRTLSTLDLESGISATIYTQPKNPATYNYIPVPSPYQAISEPVHTTIFAAILENALRLGFDLHHLATQCRPGTFYMSPFYQPNATPQDNPNILLSTALKSATLPSSCVPVSLRPTLAQILIPHHASLDLIPLPRFRDCAITAAAALPQFFNLWELKVDIYARGALMLNRSPCAPWDWESWKAAPWFMKKWSMTLSGEHELSTSILI